MSGLRVGATAADKAVYDGHHCVGYIRRSTAGCYAYAVSGDPLGAYADQRAAVAALMARAAAAKAVAT